MRTGGYDKTGVMSYCQTATAAPWLSPNDIASIELLYGRRKNHSLLTPRAHCTGAADGAGNGVMLSDCDEKAGQDWSAVTTWSKGDAWHLRLSTPAKAEVHATLGLRRHQRASRPGTPSGRARIGSWRRKRPSSSASSCAVP